MAEPSQKKAKLHDNENAEDLHAPINTLPEHLLTKIFSYIPPLQRLDLIRVCRRFAAISRLPWTDVKQLNLDATPTRKIGALLKLCPKLRSFVVSQKTLALNDLLEIPLPEVSFVSLSSVSCDVAFLEANEVPRENSIPPGRLKFSRFLSNFSNLKELCLHLVERTDLLESVEFQLGLLPFAAPASLTHLLLGPVYKVSIPGASNNAYLGYLADLLSRLENLECLILDQELYSPHQEIEPAAVERVCQALASRKQLRELGLFVYDGFGEWFLDSKVVDVLMTLPKLEVLFLTQTQLSAARMTRLTTSHPTLRILVITACRLENENAGEIVLPRRKRWGNGYDAPPLPLLNIFLGQDGGDLIRFHRSTPEAAAIFAISTPMPTFLADAKIAPIFAGCWIAAKVGDADMMFWDYAMFVFDSVQYVQA